MLQNICFYELMAQRKPWSFYSQRSCLLEFDGASKGNPGKTGAEAVLRTDDGSLVCVFSLCHHALSLAVFMSF